MPRAGQGFGEADAASPLCSLHFAKRSPNEALPCHARGKTLPADKPKRKMGSRDADY
jgi:hypothetical protein